MGDVADAMLDGDLCQCCGEYMEGGAGYPRTCPGCERAATEAAKVAIPQKVTCPTCGKKVKAAGLKDHQRDAHQQSDRAVEPK